MNQDGLPKSGLGTTLGDRPQLPAQQGGPPPFQPEERTSQQEFPGPEAQPTIKTASVDTPVVQSQTGAPPASSTSGDPIIPVLGIPRTFEELMYFITLVTPAREVTTIVEQTIAAGGSGSVTVSIPDNTVDVQRFFREGGDGSVSYRIEVDGTGRDAIDDHRVTGANREFARYFEKYQTVRIVFTNNDPANSALLQIEWISLQIDINKWTALRDAQRAWGKLLGVQE